MFGLPDASIWLAYFFALGSAALCIVYGVINWNKTDKIDKLGKSDKSDKGGEKK